MSRKHCRRKIYALVNPIALAIEGAAITDTAILDRLRLLELSALDGIGPEVLEVCKRAQEALSAGHERYQTHGTIGRVAGEYETLADLWQFHDLQRSSVSRSEYERAIKKTADRIRSLHPSVRVCIA
jgi:hypothetical protein